MGHLRVSFLFWKFPFWDRNLFVLRLDFDCFILGYSPEFEIGMMVALHGGAEGGVCLW
jgi:hypothetical protein